MFAENANDLISAEDPKPEEPIGSLDAGSIDSLSSKSCVQHALKFVGQVRKNLALHLRVHREVREWKSIKHHDEMPVAESEQLA